MDLNEEITKCKNDFFYFAENYVKIVHWRDGLVPFKLYPYQKRLIQDIQDNRFVCGVKFRQGGFTTVQAIFGLWECMFQNDQRVMIISKSDRDAISVGHIVKHVIEELPDWLKPTLTKNNDHMKIFANNNAMRFYCFEACCGQSITRLIIEEAAFIKYMNRNWKALFPTIANSGKCSAISSANGTDNWFHETVSNSISGENRFKLYTCSYLEHHEYCESKWIKQQLKWLGGKGFRQEVMCEFLDDKDKSVVEEISNNDLINKLIDMLEVPLSTESATLLSEINRRIQR